MSAFEADLARELRLLPIGAPPELRRRVCALGEPDPRRLPQLTWRRAGVVLVPACLVALLAAAAVTGLRSSRTQAHSTSSGAVVESDSVATDHKRSVFAPENALPVPSPTRHQDYEADLRVRVKDLDALGRRTADAMRITRSLGGYVASLSQTTAAGSPGEAYLTVRVPVGRVEDALMRLSALGTVLEQHVSIVDLENAVQQQRQRIRALKLQILRLSAALKQSLPADVRLRLRFQLDDARRNLANATGAHKATLGEAAMSRVSLTLTTQTPALVTKHDDNRVGRMVGGAVDFLAGAGAVALAALIVLAPLLIIAALVWYGVRTWRRREERRLLAET